MSLLALSPIQVRNEIDSIEREFQDALPELTEYFCSGEEINISLWIFWLLRFKNENPIIEINEAYRTGLNYNLAVLWDSFHKTQYFVSKRKDVNNLQFKLQKLLALEKISNLRPASEMKIIFVLDKISQVKSEILTVVASLNSLAKNYIKVEEKLAENNTLELNFENEDTLALSVTAEFIKNELKNKTRSVNAGIILSNSISLPENYNYDKHADRILKLLSHWNVQTNQLDGPILDVLSKIFNE